MIAAAVGSVLTVPANYEVVEVVKKVIITISRPRAISKQRLEDLHRATEVLKETIESNLDTKVTIFTHPDDLNVTITTVEEDQ